MWESSHYHLAIATCGRALSAAFLSVRPTEFAAQVARQVRGAILDAIGQGKNYWFLDQIALFCALASCWSKGPEARIQLFDGGIIESESHVNGQPSLSTNPVLWSVTASISANENKVTWDLFRKFELP